MTQEYTVTDVRIGDYKDNHNNTWCDVVFEELGEPVKWVMKDPSKVKVGDKVYGSVEEKESKAGNKYLRFKKEQKPEPGQEPVDWDKKDAYIRFQWAYREALAHFRGKEEVKMEEVRKLAKSLVLLVDEDVAEYIGR